MRLYGKVFFAPDVEYCQVAWEDPEILFSQFNDRIEGFLLKPAEALSSTWDSFASILITVCAIDAIIRVRKEMIREELQKKQNEIERRSYHNCCWVPRKHDVCQVKSQDWKGYLKSFENMDEGKAEIFYQQIRCGLVHEGRLKESSMAEATGHSHHSAIEYEKTMVISPESLIKEVRKMLSELRIEICEKGNGEKFAKAIGSIFFDERLNYWQQQEKSIRAEKEIPILASLEN